VYTREICYRPGEKIGILLKNLFDVAFFPIWKGRSNMEEAILLCQRELPRVPHGFDPDFGVYSRVEIIPC